MVESDELVFRTAVRDDLPAIVRLLADDALGRTRENPAEPLPSPYYAAFEHIDADPNNELAVACLGDQIVGTLQITYTPSVSYGGSWRATIESVRTRSDVRGRGIGKAFMEWAVARAGERGCRMVQLTTNAARSDAHRFYERLGFSASHVGMKRMLEP